MMVNVLTCAATSLSGLGVGLVINTLRARAKKKKRAALEMSGDTDAVSSSSSSTDAPPVKKHATSPPSTSSAPSSSSSSSQPQPRDKTPHVVDIVSQVESQVHPRGNTNRTSKQSTLFLKYGIQSYFDTLEKYLPSSKKKGFYTAYAEVRKHIHRILELIDHSETPARGSSARSFNYAGAIAVNATKVKLWTRTLRSMLKDMYSDHLHEELKDTLDYFVGYIDAEMYNRLKDR